MPKNVARFQGLFKELAGAVGRSADPFGVIPDSVVTHFTKAFNLSQTMWAVINENNFKYEKCNNV